MGGAYPRITGPLRRARGMLTNATATGVTAEPAARSWPARRSGVNRRTALRPRPRLLELRGEPQERRLVAEAAEEMRPDRQAVVGPMQRHRHRRLPGDVPDRGERRIRRRPLESEDRVVGRPVERAERQR